MKRLILPTGLALAAAAPGGAAAAAPLANGAAEAAAPTRAHARAYERAYTRIVQKLGHRAPGRNIVKDGVARGRRATDAEVVTSTHRLDAMLATVLAPAPSTVSSTASVTSAGASGVPACASESGTNYSTGASNTNASSGATGRYQITPGTASAYGCDLSTPAGQDACAQTIYEHQGASAWVGCGG